MSLQNTILRPRDAYPGDKIGNNVDRVWFDSSTVKYAECLDKDNDLKTLRVDC